MISLPKECLALIQKNDPQSQRRLYEVFKARVMGICRRCTKDKVEAEDVFQETFIKVFSCIGQLHDPQHLESWIRKVTINTAVNYYHKTKRHEHVAEKNGYHYKDEEYDLILSHFTDEMLVNIINQLPDGYRMVFNLYVIEGYNHAEIADLLQISETTSRSQLNRAKQTLKDKLRSLGILKYERYA